MPKHGKNTRAASCLIAAFFLVCTGVSAETGDRHSLDNLPMANVDNASGKFTQHTFLPGLDKPLETSGRFFFDKNTGFLWYTEAPVEQARFFAERFAYNYRFESAESGKEKIQAEKSRHASTRQIGKLTNAIIEGQWDYLEKYFSSEITATADKTHVHLTPLNARIQKHLISVSFSLSQHVESYRIELANGEVQQVSFSAVSENTGAFFQRCETDHQALRSICQHIQSIAP